MSVLLVGGLNVEVKQPNAPCLVSSPVKWIELCLTEIVRCLQCGRKQRAPCLFVRMKLESFQVSSS